jgi:16S rRNA C967 or C1407 C5-methylase (RsmB/RsmF family)
VRVHEKKYQNCIFVVSGIALLKVGGRMVYSTCSMNPIENEAVVAEVLDEFQELSYIMDSTAKLLSKKLLVSFTSFRLRMSQICVYLPLVFFLGCFICLIPKQNWT